MTSSFVDAAGVSHTLAITFGQVVGGLKAAGLDLAGTDHESLARVLYGDPFALVRCVQVLAPSAVFDGAGSEVLDDAARALEEAVTDFTLRRPVRNRPAQTTAGDSSNVSGG